MSFLSCQGKSHQLLVVLLLHELVDGAPGTLPVVAGMDVVPGVGQQTVVPAGEHGEAFAGPDPHIHGHLEL